MINFEGLEGGGEPKKKMPGKELFSKKTPLESLSQQIENVINPTALKGSTELVMLKSDIKRALDAGVDISTEMKKLEGTLTAEEIQQLVESAQSVKDTVPDLVKQPQEAVEPVSTEEKKDSSDKIRQKAAFLKKQLGNLPPQAMNSYMGDFDILADDIGSTIPSRLNERPLNEVRDEHYPGWTSADFINLIKELES
jgi:hypothetical protein